tara:strand:- start:181 stop:426 length:246 start_codon:yes stop_codon:yes gene_type:complete
MKNSINIWTEKRWEKRALDAWALHEDLKESGDDPEMELWAKNILNKCEQKLANYARLREVHAKTVADNFMLGLHRIVESIK